METKKALGELRTGLKSLRSELDERFLNLPSDSIDYTFSKKMWRFATEAQDRLADLVDDVAQADTTYTEVLKHFGEDEKNVPSSDFFGIFKTFVTSYKASRQLLICPIRR